MKKLIITLLVLGSLSVFGQTREITLKWDESPSSEQVSLYHIFQDSGDGIVKTTVEHPETTLSLSLVPGATYKFWATAENVYMLESDPSNVITYQALGVLPEVFVTSVSVGSFKGGVWQNVVVRWDSLDKSLYGFTNYTVSVENVTTGEVTLFSSASNSLTLPEVPYDSWKFKVSVTNTLGEKSPDTTHWLLPKTRPNAPIGLSISN